MAILCFITLIVHATWLSRYSVGGFSAWPVTAAFATVYQAFVTVVLVFNWHRAVAQGKPKKTVDDPQPPEHTATELTETKTTTEK